MKTGNQNPRPSGRGAVNSNERLRQLVDGANLTQTEASTFQCRMGVRGLKVSTWKGYFCRPETTRFRTFGDDLLIHAEAVFAPQIFKHIS